MHTDNSEFKINIDVVKNLMNKTAFSKSQWMAMINEYPLSYEKCPFKKDPEIKEHANKVLTEYFFNHPDQFITIDGKVQCPKDFLNDRKMIEAVQYGWLNKLKNNPTTEAAMYFLLATERAAILREKVAEQFSTLVDKAYQVFKSMTQKSIQGEELNEEEQKISDFLKDVVEEKIIGKKKDSEEQTEEAKKEIKELPELNVDKILDMYNAGKINKEKMENMLKALKREAEEKINKIYKRCGFKL